MTVSEASTGVSAGRALAALAAIFALAFGVVVLLLALEHQNVLEATSRLQRETVPEIIRYQRLTRNLEQLRLEGERVLAANGAIERKRAMLVVTLLASHPGILEHSGAARLAGETERFLAEIVQQAGRGQAESAASQERWHQIKLRIDQLIDDVSVQGTMQATANLDRVADAMVQARLRLFAVVALVGLFPLAFLLLVRRHLIQPLQRIDVALSELAVDRPPPVFPVAAMREIRVVEEAITDLHALLIEHEEARRGLERLANRDGLTSLMNRRHFLVSAEIELQRAQRYRRPVSVAMADLDHFKELNDTYGHAAGDVVLRTFALRARDTLRQSDLICRYGGEEFACLFPESTVAEAERLAERLRACILEPIPLGDGRTVSVSVSVGLADVGDSDIDAALDRADGALYEAKRQGRNRVVRAGDSRPVSPGGN